MNVLASKDKSLWCVVVDRMVHGGWVLVVKKRARGKSVLWRSSSWCALSKREGSVQHGNTDKNNYGEFAPTSLFV